MSTSDLDLASLAPPVGFTRRGWYPDPAKTAGQRYWDGKAWTDETRGFKPSGASGLLIIGIILALVFPIGGVVVAIILLARNEIGPGLAVLLTCVVGGLIFLAVTGS